MGRALGGLSPVREALVYKLAYQLDIPIFKSRLVDIDYKKDNLLLGRFPALILETKSDLAKRLKLKVVEDQDIKDPRFLERIFVQNRSVNSAVSLMFNSMILNEDFTFEIQPLDKKGEINKSLLGNGLSNMLVLERPDGTFEVIPDDFDLSGAFTQRLDITGNLSQDTRGQCAPSICESQIKSLRWIRGRFEKAILKQAATRFFASKDRMLKEIQSSNLGNSDKKLFEELIDRFSSNLESEILRGL